MMQGQFIFANLLMLILIMFMLNGCGGQDETGGATAALTWSPVISSSPISYTVHYGKYSSGQPGSCDYEDSVDVPGPRFELGTPGSSGQRSTTELSRQYHQLAGTAATLASLVFGRPRGRLVR